MDLLSTFSEPSLSSPSSSSFSPKPKHVKCATHKVSNQLWYKSAENDELISLMVSDKIEKGGNGEFFVGFTLSEHRLENLPRNKCVAIKKMKCANQDQFCNPKYRNAKYCNAKYCNGKHCDANYCNTTRVLKWLQRHIDGTKRGHIAKLFDAGFEEATNSFVIVSELGDETLKHRLYAENRLFLAEEMVMKITVPLLELHQVAMHLDIKPSNYVFVKSESDALKLIDFDGAELLVGNGGIDQHKMPQVDAHTMQYMSPEQDEHLFKERKELSVKADIWAIGIITCEIILQNRYYDYFFSKDEDLRVDLVLHYIGKYFRGYRLVTEKNKHCEEEQKASRKVDTFDKLNFDSEEWLDKSNYYFTLAHIMRMAADYPLLFHLITNTLNIEPEKRMTARGIVDYLNKKCIPGTSKQIDNVSSLPFFHKVTVGILRRTFEKRKDQKMLGLLGIVEEKQRKAMDELRMRGITCETKNILLGEETNEFSENDKFAKSPESESGQNEEENESKSKIKRMFSLKSKEKPKNDFWAIAKKNYSKLSKNSREEGDKPFFG
ncbi:hypothetical protein niasHT_023734 [Heterodera trifolii]|uniref:Protein kinase domain-containing protein n=1 Tax=Heterodera trifolii TaxID=157864 RepID=A0ABD2K1V7_9BILA